MKIEDILLEESVVSLDEGTKELRDKFISIIKSKKIVETIKKNLSDEKSIERKFIKQLEKEYKKNGSKGALQAVREKKDKANYTAKKLEHFFFKNYVGSTILNVSFVRLIASPLMEVITSHLDFLPDNNPTVVAITFSFIFDNIFRARFQIEQAIGKKIKKRNHAFQTVRKNLEVM